MTYLNTAHDGGGERRVVLRAQHDGVHENEAAQHSEGEFYTKRSHTGLHLLTNDGYQVYPMTQESTNCTTNIRSDQPLYATACTQTHTEGILSTNSDSLIVFKKITKNKSSPSACPLNNKHMPQWGRS